MSASNSYPESLSIKLTKKKFREFTFMLQYCNRMTDKVFCTFFMMDLFLACMIPLEQLLDFDILNKNGIVSTDYNVILQIGKQTFFPYLTDALNGIVLAIVIMLFAGFITYLRGTNLSPIKARNFCKGFMSFLSLSIMLIVKCIGHFSLAIQILAVRCYFESGVCHAKTDNVRLATNVAGMTLTCFLFLI